MLALARWLSETAASGFLRERDWLIPLLQTIHIIAIATVLSSVLMIDLRVLRLARAQSQSIADAVGRFAAWIWGGLIVLALSGAPLIVAEPRRTLPNPMFQIKLTLLALAVAATIALLTCLRRNAGFREVSVKASGAARLLAVVTLALWCAVAVAGRFIAYTQPA